MIKCSKCGSVNPDSSRFCESCGQALAAGAAGDGGTQARDLSEFVASNQQREGGTAFQLENSKLLEVKVDGILWAKAGSMIAYKGTLKFTQKSGGGLGQMLIKAASGEGAQTMEVSGQGLLYLADQGKEVHIIKLQAGESISINGNDALAFQPTVQWKISLMRKAAGMMSGGLYNMQLTGPGLIAFTTHGKPLVLSTPVVTDPQSTVAWSAKTQPGFKSDVNLRTLLGRSSGETFQMDFKDPGGFVVVQPFEEGGSAPGGQ